MGTSIWAIATVLFGSLAGSFGGLLLKKGSDSLSFNLKKIATNWKLIVGLGIYAFSAIIFIGALRFGELTVLYPLVSTTYIWVALLSIKYLNEQMNWKKWAGILFIMVGVSFIGLGS